MASITAEASPSNSVTSRSRIRTSFLGLAVCDALGAPLEGRKRRSTNNYLTEMVGNSGLNPGHFTDDTSMALCLAHSLTHSRGKTNYADQARRYLSWLEQGYMSSLQAGAFGVGRQTRQVLPLWRGADDRNSAQILAKVKQEFSSERKCGNGSLMRVLPCALIADSEKYAISLARESSDVTHPCPRNSDACAIYCSLVYRVMGGAKKEQLVERLSQLSADPELDSVLRDCLVPYQALDDFKRKPREEISSSGYVVHSLEAALWSFFTTSSFEEGAVEAVNLGDDADTVAAIYGGLAGAYYAPESCIPRIWLAAMRKLELVEEAVDKLCLIRQG